MKKLILLIILISFTFLSWGQQESFYKYKIAGKVTASSGLAIGATVKITDTVAGGMWMQAATVIPYNTTIRYAISHSLLIPTGASSSYVDSIKTAVYTSYKYNATSTNQTLFSYVGTSATDTIILPLAEEAAGSNIIVYKTSSLDNLVINGNKSYTDSIYTPSLRTTYKYILIMNGSTGSIELQCDGIKWYVKSQNLFVK